MSYRVNVGNSTAEWLHYWERCVGSGHAALALRADYQSQLTQITQDLGFKQVRFHGLFVDDMSVVLPGDGLFI
jgi:xylan 1,4-beta-xylosidase